MRRWVYGLLSAVVIVTMLRQLAIGDVPMGLLTMATATALLTGHRLADAPHRNGIAAAILLCLNAAVFGASGHSQTAMASYHLLLIPMSFVLIERQRVGLLWVALAPALVLPAIESAWWAPSALLWGERLIHGVASLGTAAGVLVLTELLTTTRNAMAQEAVLDAAAPLVASEAQGQPPLEARAPRQSSARALVVDDNPINLKVAVRNLEKLGCEVHTGTDGRQAVDLLDELDVDVVFMDIQMPVMDGFEATQVIRKREAGSESRVPIVAMTAHAMAGYRELCLDAGMDGYVTKPLRLVEMSRVLRRFVGAAPDGEATHRSEEEPANEAPRKPRAALDPTVVDRAQLEEAGGDDVQIQRELLEMLLESGTKNLEQATEALHKWDEQQVRRSIHSLKGAAATLGATRLAKACLGVESQRLERVADGLEEVRTQLQALRTVIEALATSEPHRGR